VPVTAPDLGAHTEEILMNLLNYNSEKIKELRAEGVV